MFNRPIKLALILSAAWFSQAGASAGELTLFSGAGMQGRDLTVRTEVRNLTDMGFNDRAGSMVVRSGRWEVCSAADFREDCRVFEPGEYRSLDRLTNVISSVREIGGGRGRDDDRGDGRGDGRGDDRGDGRWRGHRDASMTLFDNPGMRGRSLVVRGAMTNLQQQRFNDRAQSMLVEGGTWEVCVAKDFGGQCRVFEPGEYRFLDRNFRNTISSVRQVRRGGGRDDNPRGDGVELFSTGGFGGERVQVRNEVRNLEQANFNDRAGSLIVYSGQWEFCQHSEFRGQCITYGPGRYDRLGFLNNQISSVRRVR